ncbi:unnamed protein product [Symbiodinium necroappetens]|uniref:N-acetyltransferase domain-containing protein n=1 Tax=Symbiodinium necroappetens TaxID=1628268 RepID=A0A812J7T9_9DINO|nr:unnamed protein product [Symbiodinium necroappetens]
MDRQLGPLPRWPTALAFRRVRKEDLEACASLEAASYPADEAASPENLALRQRVANDFFWGAFEKSNGSLVGFVCGTCAAGTSLTHESMEKHVPGGELLCVHSVVVQKHLRRKGVASAMLREYLRAVAALHAAPGSSPPRACALIAKAGLVSLYVNAGFQLVGLSPVVHGADPWFELQVRDIVRTASGEHMIQCDAFAAVPCTGNSAAVVFSHRGGDASWMQKVAMENNLAETAFVELLSIESESNEEAHRFAIRWFTPTCEVDLCGHATLGAAHALWTTGRASKRRRIDFESKASGTLSCSMTDTGWIQMDFPADMPKMADASVDGSMPTADALGKALGLSGSDVLAIGRGKFDILCELSPTAFDRIKPDQSALACFECRGVCVTTQGCEGSSDAERAAAAAAGSVVDFRSRFFGPRAGIPEDPVTGSAHCMLGPYWMQKLGRGSNGANSAGQVIGFQASPRGGVVKCEVRGNGRVVLSGPAVTTLEGMMYCN